jgi:hypothetical protein
MNVFRCTPDKSLDRQYLRVCAVHKLLDRRLIDKARAVELLAQRKVPNALVVVELWLASPVTH